MGTPVKKAKKLIIYWARRPKKIKIKSYIGADKMFNHFLWSEGKDLATSFDAKFIETSAGAVDLIDCASLLR